MPSSRTSLVLLLVVASGAAAYLFLRPKPATDGDAKPPVPASTQASTPPRETFARAASPGTLPPLVEASAPAEPIDLPSLDAVANANLVTLAPGQVLARVGGQPITPAELGLVGSPAALRVPRDDYEARLERAILTEATFQAATAAGLDVEGERTAQQARVTREQTEAAARMAAQGLKWSSSTPESQAAEARELAAIALQQKLLGARGRAVGTPTADELVAWRKANPAVPEAEATGRARAALQEGREAEMQAFLRTLREGARVEKP